METLRKKKWRTRGLAAMLVLLMAAGLWRYVQEYVSISNNVNGREMPICSVETQEKKVALTFDVSWGNKDIHKILDILEIYQARASFFVTGMWAEKYPQEVKAIQDKGHDLGNHSEDHKNMKGLSLEEKDLEIQRAHQRIEKLTGIQMDLFRPPYGDYDDEVIMRAKEQGYDTVLWNVDSMDWKDYGKDQIVNTVLRHKELTNGSIIRFHCGTKYTAEALGEVIQGLQEQGYEITPLSGLIYREEYHMDVKGRQIRNRQTF